MNEACVARLACLIPMWHRTCVPDTDVAQDLEDYGVDRQVFRVVVWVHPGFGCVLPNALSYGGRR